MSIVATTPDISREIEPAAGAVLVAAPAEYQILPLDKVLRSRLNPRKHFDEAYIAELAESIKTHGQLQPIVVRPTIGGFRGFVDIIMGECRHRACELAGLKTIKAIVRTDVLSDDHHIELALIENLHRRDIDPIEEANGYQQLAAMGYKQADICAKVNRSQAAVSNAMRLLKLPESVTDLVAKGDLSVAHALAIVKYAEWPAVAVAIANHVVQYKTSSKDIESDNNLWQLWNTLEDKKLVVPVYHEDPWEKTCKACPFNSYRGDQRDNRGSGRCFKPEHYAELQSAHRVAAEAKIAKETEALRKRAETNKRLADKLATGSPAGVSVRTDDNTKALHLRDLGYDKYEQIRREDVEGCSEACPCRTVAIDHGGEPCRICIDPAHRRALKGQATRIERIRIRKENQERQALWCKLTEAGYTRSMASVGFRRVLAILAWSYIRKASAEARRSVAKGLSEESLKGLLCAPTYSVKDIDAFQILEAQEPGALLAVLGSIDIEWEAKLCVEAANDKTPIADFLLAPAPAPEPEAPKYLDCPKCVGLMTLKAADKRYECGCGHVQPAEGVTP